MRRAKFALIVWTEGSWEEAGRAQQVLRECLDRAKADGGLFDYGLDRVGELELTESQETRVRAGDRGRGRVRAEGA